jgi:hypothetical protein
MKTIKYASLVLGLFALGSSVNAAITISASFGQAFNTDGTTPVATGTLWALIVDGGDGTLPGGLTANTSLAGLVAANGASATTLINTTFDGVDFTLGTLFGTDTVFALGGFTGLAGAPGTAAPVLELTIGTYGVAVGRVYGFYFFPGKIFTTQGATYTADASVGGINSSITDSGAGFDSGMVIPSDGATAAQGALTNAGGDLGGSMSDSSFAAVAIPEPSAVLLGSLGALFLLRRRRN